MSEYSFTLDGIGFSGMPLERVAKYITALADLVGETAIFVRMTEHSIVFADGGDQSIHQNIEITVDTDAEGGEL